MQQIQGPYKGWSHRKEQLESYLKKNSGFYILQGEMVLTCLKPLGAGGLLGTASSFTLMTADSFIAAIWPISFSDVTS